MRRTSSATLQAGGAVLWTIVVVALTVAGYYGYKALGFYRENVAPAVAEVTKLAGAVKSVGEQGVIDVLGITGYYTTLAMVMNTTRTPLPDGVKPPLAPLPR